MDHIPDKNPHAGWLIKSKRLILCLALCGLALLLAGCVWLRLLSFKNQLADLDRFTTMEERDGLTIHFRKPILHGDDLFVLVSSQPTVRTTNQNRQTWSWVFEKIPALTNAEAGSFDITLDLRLENSKIEGLHFQERVLTLFPKALIRGVLRSLGKAKVNARDGSLSFNWVDGGPAEKFDPIVRGQITRLLGLPFYQSESNSSYSCLYKYAVKDAGEPAWAKFTFATNSDRLYSSEGCLGNVGWSLTAIPADSGMKVNLFFTQPRQQPAGMKLDARLAQAVVGRYKTPAGYAITIGRDGDLFAIDGGLETPENALRGWWIMRPGSSTNLYAPGGDRTARFGLDEAGNVNEFFLEEHGFVAGYSKFSNEPPRQPPAAAWDPHQGDAFTGRYKPRWQEACVTVSREGDHLLWDGIPMYPASETNFFFKLADSPVSFVRNDKGEVTQAVLHYSGTNDVAERLR